jgi:hypothetical protein
MLLSDFYVVLVVAFTEIEMPLAYLDDEFEFVRGLPDEFSAIGVNHDSVT